MNRPRIKNPIVGYVVSAEQGLFELGEGYAGQDENGVLWFGGAVTLFKTEKEAKRAIARSKKYRDKEWPGMTNVWPWIDKATITAVRRRRGVR